MQELYQVIKERYERVGEFMRSEPSNDVYREFRDEQKARSQKQTWIISMFRAKKSNSNTLLKATYFNFSYKIMKIINPAFVYDTNPALSEESFLNDFVCLFTAFFDSYEEKFQFKLRIKNFLRPTNHNLVTDLIKYLSDFSRDYCQYMYYWHTKNAKKQQETRNKPKINLVATASTMDPNISNANQCSQQKKSRPYRHSVNILQTRLEMKKSTDESDLQNSIRKQELNRLFGILEVVNFNNFLFSEKSKGNIDAIKLRINEVYRDAKYRNNPIKSSINSYNTKHNPTFIMSRQCVIEDSFPYISFPYKVSILIEKNGYSCLNLVYVDKKSQSSRQDRNFSPIRDTRVATLSGKQGKTIAEPQNRSCRSQFILNSLKVLRVSQNYLPPLNNYPIKSTKQVKQIKQLSSNTENAINLQIVQLQQQKREGAIYYNQELLREAQRKNVQKKRISELRKQFTSQDKIKYGKKEFNDPEQKITSWLNKINFMKQLERNKIMGLG